MMRGVTLVSGRPAASIGIGRVAALALACACGAIALAGASAVPAAASVTLGGAQIVVQGQGASAVITRAPFGIEFRNASGTTVLSEVATSDEPLTLAPTLPGAPAEMSGEALYAPLSFLVGRDSPRTFASGQFEGDLIEDEEAGTEYSAREVLSAASSGEGVALTLSTDDPSGRTLSVSIAPAGAAAIGVSAAPQDPSGVAAMADSFNSSPSEAFHGFGGRHNALDQHGADFYNWVDQENTDIGAGAEGDLAPDGPQAAYYVQSSFVSNAGYGFLLNTGSLSRWRLDAERPDAWQTEAAAPSISYVVAPGDISQAAASLTAISGRQRVPPSWAIGPLFDREVELTDTASTYEAKVESDLQEIVARRLPVRAYRIEGWGFVSHTFLESVIARLKALGIRPLLYFRPFVGTESIGTELPDEYRTAVENDYLTTNASGEPYIFNDNFGGKAGVIDFTNPAAIAWWRQRIDAALDLGAEGFMLDFGEQVQPDMHFSNGETGAEMHNSYPVLVQKVTREAVEAYEAAHPGRSIVFFTRSGYSGEPGSAAYESFNFPGDETTDWSQSSGLASQTRDMLNRAIGGAYGFGTDIGGYYDLGVPPTSKELFQRWAEWAALTPVFRLHGAIQHEHTPWAQGIRSVNVYRQLSELHISAQPLISRLWREADETGMPITRPLYMAYPGDPQAALQDQEWLLGPDVLVAPVVERGAISRSVYFPSGCWEDPETGLQVSGPRYETVDAAVRQLPFFFHCATEPFTPAGRFGRALRRRR